MINIGSQGVKHMFWAKYRIVSVAIIIIEMLAINNTAYTTYGGCQYANYRSSDTVLSVRMSR